MPERGTLKELYANINEDIEKALPMIDDSHLTSAKYHFNKSAAYAFAARFNLYYLNFKKAKEYASVVVGSNPGSVLRQMSSYSNLAGTEDIGNNYIIFRTLYASKNTAQTTQLKLLSSNYSQTTQLPNTLYPKAAPEGKRYASGYWNLKLTLFILILSLFIL